MTPEEVVRAELEAWDRLDLDGIMGLFAQEATWDNIPIGPVTGHDAIRKAAEGWIARMTSFRAEILNIASSGDIVLTERIDHTDFDGNMLHARVMGAFEVSGDKIRAWRDYFDLGGHTANG